ncbi:MAG: type II toxin-antitoxin system VapC family toxin [Gemmataceae bacterium]|nr:type II toxin-antitoxin system VapC family toxin [Gemmataceae bacterium]
MLVLVDSGILLRLFEPADPLHGFALRAVQTLRYRATTPVELVIAPQNAAEFWSVCTRPSSARGGLGLSIPETERRLRAVEQQFSVLSEPPTAYAQWRQLVVTHGVKGKQVHDARLVATMQSHAIRHILTLNGEDFTRFPFIVVIDPTSTFFVPP